MKLIHSLFLFIKRWLYNRKMKKDFGDSLKNISDFYKQYSLDDIFKSLYILGSYPLNNGSPIQHNFQYEALRGMKEGDFKKENQIKDYKDFASFSEELHSLTPAFPMLEDYSPPIDWGDTRYYFDDELEYLIWGVDGNSYDQISEFEIIFTDNEEQYSQRTGRSPSQELIELLKLHSSLKININTGIDEYPEYVEPGYFEVPNRSFWQDMIGFLYEYYEGSFPSLVASHTIEIEDIFQSKSNEKKFYKELEEGSPISSLFVRSNGKYYPLLLRYSIENLVRSWQREFSKYHNQEDFFKKPTNAQRSISVGLSMYLNGRFGKSSHPLPVLMEGDKPGKTMLVSLSFIENTVLGVVSPSPSTSVKDLEKEIYELATSTMTALQKFKTENPKFFLPTKSSIVELQPKDERIEYDIKLIVVIPIQSGLAFRVKLPRIDGVEYIRLSEFLSIADEIDDEEDLLRFLDYKEQDNIFYTDLIDAFGSYKDSSGTLVAGADDFNMAVITPTWGTSYRFKSLSDFWSLYPNIEILDDPRGWKITKETETRLRFVKKSLFHSMIYSKYGDTHFLQSSPFSKQEYEVGAVSNLLMESLEDTLSRVSDVIEKMPIFQYGYRIEVHYFPSDFLSDEDFKHLLHLATNGEKWAMDSGKYRHMDNGVRVVYDYDLVTKLLRENKDNTLELQLAKDVLIKLNELQPHADTLAAAIKAIDKLAGKPRFTQIAIEKEASHPQHSTTISPTEIENKRARKITARAVKDINQKAGKYIGDEAHKITNQIITSLRLNIEEEMSKFSYDKSIKDLVGVIDAEIAKYNYKRLSIVSSLQHDVDYAREENLSENKRQFLLQHRNNRYLLEKFVSLRPTGSIKLKDSDIRNLMAMVDEIVGAYYVSDALHYDVYQPSLEVFDDYQLSVLYAKDVLAHQNEFNKKQSQYSLGQIGKREDRLEHANFENFTKDLDGAFLEDFGFRLSIMLAIQRVLSLWSEYTEDEESESYEETVDRIVEVSLKTIKGTGKKEIKAIINFLVLESDKVLTITDDPNKPVDVPVWEHIKRPYRYSVRPLIRHQNNIVWGAYSLHMSLGMWNNIITDIELPMNLIAPQTKAVLDKEHQKMDKLLEAKSIEIAKRYTPFVKNMNPKDAGFPKVLGDYDALVYLEKSNTLINIEAKNINTPKVTKDARRQIDTVFFKEKNYLEKVEAREKYLTGHYKDFEKALGVVIKDNPTIISVFVMTDLHFWTDNPPRATAVKILRVDSLDDFIKNLDEQV